MSDCATTWNTACQTHLSFSLSQSLFRFVSIESVIPSNHLILWCSPPPSFCLQSFPASGSFPISQLFATSGQSIGASTSASVLLVNIQGWFPLGLTGLISLLSKGLSRVFSNTTIQKHQFFGTQPSLWFKRCQSYNKPAAAAKSLQSCLTLRDPIDSSPPGSPVPRILQARTLEWVAISFSNAWKWRVKVKSLSRVWLLVTPWTAAHKAPPSMGFSRQEYWSGVPT